MNQVALIGNLTKDPDVRYTTGNNPMAVCRFILAVNDKKKNHQTGQYEDNPSFIPIVVFGKQAENCGKYLAKGKKCAVLGKIQTGSYEKDGQKRYTTDVIANNIEFLTPSGQSGDNQQQGYSGFGQDQTSFGFDAPVGFEQMAEEENIPF